jgi:hypothetical protein
LTYENEKNENKRRKTLKNIRRRIFFRLQTSAGFKRRQLCLLAKFCVLEFPIFVKKIFIYMFENIYLTKKDLKKVEKNKAK